MENSNKNAKDFHPFSWSLGVCFVPGCLPVLIVFYILTPSLYILANIPKTFEFP